MKDKTIIHRQTTEIALKVISDKIVMDKQRKKSTEPELKVIPNKIVTDQQRKFYCTCAKKEGNNLRITLKTEEMRAG